MNLCADLKNVSTIIVSSIKSISFEVFNESGTVVSNSDNVKVKDLSLASGKNTKTEFNNTQLISKSNTIVWKFQCEDPYSTIHYYKATLNLNNEGNKNLTEYIWNVEKIG